MLRDLLTYALDVARGDPNADARLDQRLHQRDEYYRCERRRLRRELVV